MNRKPKHTKSYHEGHPNPQRYRESCTVLNGKWNFVFDEENIGMDMHYENEFPKDCLEIIAPFPYQSPASGINLPEKQCDVVWYERTFTVNDLEKANILTFDSVDYITTVYINGKFALKHEGGYDIFRVDVTPFAKVGENKVTLRVEDEMHMDQIRGKQRWRKDSFFCYYVETTGIVRDVYLEELNRRHIDDITVRTSYADKKMTVDLVTVGGKGASFNLVMTDANGNTVLDKNFALDADSKKLEIEVGEVEPWCYGNPYLYDLEFTLCDGEEILDNILSYCGFVTYAIKDKRFYVNGKDTYLKFVLDQGYWSDTITTPTESEIIGDVERTLECGFNGARMHEHNPSHLNFYYLDLYGLYIWHECPSPYGYSYVSNVQCRKQFPRIIHDHFSHPCIMAYTIFNESWGIDDVRKSEEIQQLTIDMYNYVKSISGDRFAIANDGWEHTVTDIITFHNYLETYDQLVEKFTAGLEAVYSGGNALTTTKKEFFARGYTYQGQPVMFSEFAGIAFDRDTADGWGYGKSVRTEEDFLAKYAGQLRFILEREDIRGFCATQLTDVYQEKNGFYTMEREVKADISKIRALHEQFKD